MNRSLLLVMLLAATSSAVMAGPAGHIGYGGSEKRAGFEGGIGLAPPVGNWSFAALPQVIVDLGARGGLDATVFGRLSLRFSQAGSLDPRAGGSYISASLSNNF
jgi:hypothetical protein